MSTNTDIIQNPRHNVEEIIKSKGGKFIQKYKLLGKWYVDYECENGHISSKLFYAFEKTWCCKCV